MSLQFIIGKQTTNKRKEYIQDISEKMIENPNAQFFIIVPEHAKFEGEMTILEEIWALKNNPNPSFMGSINLQIFSFSRLAWFFLKDHPIFQKKQLSDAGISMVIRKILLEKEEELILFRKEVDKEGFVAQLTDLFKELRAGRITPQELRSSQSLANDSIRQTDLHIKMEELAALYESFCMKMGNDFLQYEDLLELLAATIAQNQMEDVYLYIDGFYRFTAQEMQIISSFLQSAKKVTISLDLDKPYVDALPDLHNLFHVSGATYHRLYHFAKENRINILQDKKPYSQTDGYEKGFLELDDYWIHSSSGLKKTGQKTEWSGATRDVMEIWGCDTKQAEIFHVANSINRLVLEKGYRYKEFLILARRVEDYETILKPLFSRAHLKVFYDKAEEMRHHPFTDFIDSIYKIRKNYWRYPDVMRLLRTELMLPNDLLLPKEESENFINNSLWEYRDVVDKTENILLAYGFEGNAWMKKDDWKIYSFDDSSENEHADPFGIVEANFMKQFLQNTLLPYYQKISKVKTGKEAAILLFQFLQENGIDKQMINWRDDAIEKQELERARQHEQVWKTFTLLLDEYVETMGDTPFDEAIFHEVLMTGFEAATFSIVPPSIDEVIFSSMDGARFSSSKVVYILGATEGNLPQVHENHSLLTEEDRETLHQSLQNEEKYIRPSITESTAAEPFIAYQSFLAATEKIFITYPFSVDGSNRVSKLSPYVQRIANEMDIRIEHRAADITDAIYPINFTGTKNQNISQLVKLLRVQQTSNQKIPVLWRKILTYLSKNIETKEIMDQVFPSLWHKNQPVPLTAEIAEKLYGKNLYLSVSQLESYYEDSYSHFLKYGLRLKERQKYELSAAGTGEFYHEALEHIVQKIRTKNVREQKEVEKITQQVLQHLFGTEKYAILSSSNRMNFIREQLSETIQRMSWVIHNHQEHTAFQNLRTEAVFGQPGVPDVLEGLHFPLKDGKSLSIRGKIDRIDIVPSKDKQYLSILDYKSSQHTFDFTEAYYGLAMQMITYLDVALTNAATLLSGLVIPAGAFYLHVKNPFLEMLEKPADDEWKKLLLKENKWRGLLIADKEISDALDPSAEESGSSLVLPFKYKKDGNFAVVNDLVTADELALLIANNRRRIEEAGERILSGDLQLNPIKGKLYTPSVQGPYRAVSQFDSTLQENRYRRLEKMKKNQVFNKLREELTDKSESEEDVDDPSKN
ncbi:PD-(D/E)XK nuclease family protein [Jeotgalibaca sp. MA1X17-3]|uniref:PD-(D/E)XK nuclease family protein n=1 Tax=Jeotgalibaca sp. MA1X17-3 TaxID=2908211 RepID=UPI001F23BBCB|nr:PD-(D/E)XK nuclease family protein [Jeotgalibaca sp. MA1X17-3]UJF14746.1 PD-(D/E)XK nuclease family protein [Jeotgalibaca sp. MA1X17-3]